MSQAERDAIYNGLDSCITLEVNQKVGAELRGQNDPSARLIYDFERGMQGPALDMMLRGFRIDRYQRGVEIDRLTKNKSFLEGILNQFGMASWGRPINARSHVQLKELFYQVYNLPEQFRFERGERKVTINREALEKLSAYNQVLPLINSILAVRDTGKLLSTIQTEIDTDGRMRTSYNVAGTETGRWSSASSAFGTGTNLQNLTPEIRRMFIADDGMMLCNIDEEQAESRVMGLLIWALCGDPSYLLANETGDVHTAVARLCWPHLPWNGDLRHDREIAERPFYRHFSYRDMSKRGGHLTNYYGTPPTMARNLKIEERVAADFQLVYFRAFPGLREYHHWVAREIGINQELTTPLGRRRIFFGRPGDDSTLREAIAYIPQSTVGDILNCALWRIWRYCPNIELLAQVHDSICFQAQEKALPEEITRAKELAQIPFEFLGKKLVIPVDAKAGWNWADDEIKTSRGKIKNPDGLRKWKGSHDGRRRSTGLDQLVS